jgi:hypothetical protein
MAPLAAVGGDVAENLLTWFALACHGIGADMVANCLLWLGGVGAAIKLAGLAACAPLVVVRCVIALRAMGGKQPAAAASGGAPP